MIIDLNEKEVEIILQAFEEISCGSWPQFVSRYNTATGISASEDEVEAEFADLDEKIRALVM